MGSKARIAKHILPIILKDRKPGQYYVEPFVGGANLIDKVDGNRIGADINEYLIALLQALASGWVPSHISESEYKEVRDIKGLYDLHEIGFAGLVCTYSAKFFGGYAQPKNGRNYVDEGIRNCLAQAPFLKGVKFVCSAYSFLEIPDSSIVYCDPPYEGTTGYKTGAFNHAAFWQWCRDKSLQGHSVFISEYNAPEDFTVIWQGEINMTLAQGKGKKALEKLFVYTGDLL